MDVFFSLLFNFPSTYAVYFLIVRRLLHIGGIPISISSLVLPSGNLF